MITEKEIEQLMREDHAAVTRDAKIPSAGAIYWRASIRARSEAARKVEQPFAVVHGLTAAAVAGVGVAMAGYAWQSPFGPMTTLGLGVAALVVISPLALMALGSRMRFDRPQD